MISSEHKPLRVLSLDGGGMRGTYTATNLERFGLAASRLNGEIDHPAAIAVRH